MYLHWKKNWVLAIKFQSWTEFSGTNYNRIRLIKNQVRRTNKELEEQEVLFKKGEEFLRNSSNFSLFQLIFSSVQLDRSLRLKRKEKKRFDVAGEEGSGTIRVAGSIITFLIMNRLNLARRRNYALIIKTVAFNLSRNVHFLRPIHLGKKNKC